MTDAERENRIIEKAFIVTVDDDGYKVYRCGDGVVSTRAIGAANNIINRRESLAARGSQARERF